MKITVTVPLFLIFVAIQFVTVDGVCPHLRSGLTKFSTLSGWNSFNSSVIIQNGQYIILDASPPQKLYNIEVSGDLIFNDTNIDLNVEWIKIHPTGRLFIGSQETGCSIKSKIRIIFHGARNTEQVMGYDPQDSVPLGYKGLAAVTGSSVEIVGDVKGPTWTRLTKNAVNGTNSITVEDAVQWVAGDTIVIATTDYPQTWVKNAQNNFTQSVSWQYGRGTPNQNELRTVVSVTGGGKIITFDSPLNFTHWGTNFERAEVGLINRRIVFQGDDSTENSLFGGHFMMRKLTTAVVRGVEIYRMGQRGVLGRYPLHIHLAKESWDAGYLFKDNSFHQNFQRCVVIHHTSGVKIEGNVAYNNNGHCYFLEDASERGNIFNKNLGIRTLPIADENPLQILPTDSQPAMFWITNPNNTFTNNAAVSARFGYWYAMPVSVTGPSADDFASNDTWVRPRWSPLGGFNNNIAHSNSRNGLHVDDMEVAATHKTELASYSPRVGPYAGTSFSSTGEAIFDNFITYKNRQYGVWARGGPMIFNNLKSLDNLRGHNSPPAPSVLQNSYIVGETDNIGNPLPAELGRSRPDPYNNGAAIKGWETYDNSGNQFVKDTVFENFTTNSIRKAGVLSPLECGPFLLQARDHARNLTFINANQVWINPCNADGPNNWAIFDTDGSVTGKPQWIVSNSSMLIDSSCTQMNDWNGWMCPPFGGRYIQLFATIIGASNLTESVYNGTFTNNLNNGITHGTFYQLGTNNKFESRGRYLSGNQGDFQVMCNMKPRNGGYMVNFIGDITPPHITVRMASTLPFDWLFVAIPYPATHFPITVSLYQYSMTTYRGPVQPVDSLSKLVSKYYYYYDQSAELLYVRLDSVAEDNVLRWGFTNFDGNDGFIIGIKSNCSGGFGTGCVKSTKLNIPNPINIESFEDEFTCQLQYCQSVAHSIRDNKTRGDVMFRLNPLNKTLSYYVVHDQTNNQVQSITINKAVIGLTGSQLVNFTFVDNPIHFYTKLTRRMWINLLRGELYVSVKSGGYSESIRGQIGCINGKDCSLPGQISSFDPCTFFDQSNSLAFYTDVTNVTRYNFYRYVGTTPGFNTTLSINDTTSPLCGTQAVAFTVTNGNIQFGLNPRIYINPTVYKYLSFYAKVSEGIQSLNMFINNGTHNILTKSIQQYIENYYLDTEWSRVKVPLDEYGFGANQTVSYIGFARTDTRGAPITVYIDEVRFIKEVTESKSVGITKAEVYAHKEICTQQTGLTATGSSTKDIGTGSTVVSTVPGTGAISSTSSNINEEMSNAIFTFISSVTLISCIMLSI